LLNYSLNSQNKDRWFIEKTNGEFGFIDSLGNEVFTGKFKFIDREYNSGLVYFQKERKRGYLDKKGNEIFISKDAKNSYSEGLVAFKTKGKFYYLNTKGKISIDLSKIKMPINKEISKIFDFKNGLAMIRLKNKGFIDFEAVGCLRISESTNLYPDNWVYGFINKKGHWVFKPIFESATTFKNGMSIVIKDKKKYFLKTNGNLILSKYESISEFSEGFASVYENNTLFFVNENFERIGNLTFDDVMPFSNGMAAVKIDKKWGFIDTSGKMVIKPQYYSRSQFNEGVAPVSLKIEDSNYDFFSSYFIEGFINKDGTEFIPFKKHIDYGKFINGIAKGRKFLYSKNAKNKKYTGFYEFFYINKKGEKIWSEVIKQ